MRIKVLREDLLEGIQTVQNTVPTRTTLPVLSNVLIETERDKVLLVATDLDIGISKTIKATIQEEGAITIPARKFFDIVRELPENEEIAIAVRKNNSIHITCGYCFFRMIGIPKEEFPRIPKIEKEEILKLAQSELKGMLELTSFAISRDETRYVLNGVLFDIGEKRLNLVATDGRRLALVKKEDRSFTEQRFQMIVPIKTIQELSRILKDEGEVKIIYNENQICFELNGTVVISRLIEGEFPNYEQVIPEEKKTKIKIERLRFLQAIRRANLFTTSESLSVRLELFKDKMVVAKITPEIGEAREEIPIEYGGREFAIGFNPNYLIDVLKNLNEEEIALELEDSERPGVIRFKEYIYIVLPMQLA